MEVLTREQKIISSKRNLAVFLGIFLGGTGIQFIYIGQYLRGILQLGFFILSLISIPTGIGAIFAFGLPIVFAIEALFWLRMSKEDFYDKIQTKKWNNLTI